MNRPVAVLLSLTATAIIAYPSTSTAIPPVGQPDNGFSKTDERYLHTYVQCWHAFKAECGRNIVDDGLSSGKAPSTSRVEDSTATMDRWLNPPAPEPVANPVSESVAPAPEPTTTSVAPTTAGMPPESIAQCESGGSYTAVNPSSGAYGKWQILPSTSAAYGCDMSTASGQDQCAAEIYSDVGSSAWVCAG